MVDSNFLRGLAPLIEKVCTKHNISLLHGKIIIHHYFKSLRDYLEDPRIPTVYLPWGQFRFSVSKMQKAIYKIDYFRREKGFYVKKITESKKKFWIELLRRCQEESCKIPTYMKWKTQKRRKHMQELFDNIDKHRKEHKNANFVRWRARKNKEKKERKDDDFKEGSTKSTP